MKERLKTLAPIVGFPLFYLFALALFVRWTFPYDKLRDRLVLTFNQQQRESGGDHEVTVEELGPSWLTGLRATGVRVLGAPPEPGKPPTEIKFDEARVSLLGLLFGNLDISVDAFGGTLKGDAAESSKERKVQVAVDSVSLALIPAIAQATGVPAEGSVSGTLKLTMADAKASKATGSVSLDAKDVAIGDGKAKLKGLFALPRLVLGELVLTGEAKDGLLKVSKLTAAGKDVELQGEGRIQFKEALMESPCDFNIRFKINDAYRSKNDTTKSLFGAPGSPMPALFDLDPRVKQSKQSNGFYSWRVHGALNKLDADPAPSALPPAALPPAVGAAALGPKAGP